MNGCIIPYTQIAVDLWKCRQGGARVRYFFLSHVQVDKSFTLSSTWTLPIYCSPISKQLLLKRFPVDAALVHELCLNTKHVISLSSTDDTTMTVTLIEAQHCPGAVMFLFEGYFGRIIYTGDFRFSDSLLECELLKEFISSPVDVLYLDNTYCSPKCVYPPRSDCVQQIIDIVCKHSTEKIVIGLRSLGKEDILIKLAETFHIQIGVSEERYQTMEFLNAAEHFQAIAVGSEFSPCRIDAIPMLNISQQAMDAWNKEQPTIAILPTAIFVGLGFQPFESRTDIYVVPCTDHSAYAELHQFVRAVKPKSVIPIVKGDSKDPLTTSLLDRTSVECFQEYLDMTPMQNYHIPPAVLELMNQATANKDCRSQQGKKRNPIRQITGSNVSRGGRAIVAPGVEAHETAFTSNVRLNRGNLHPQRPAATQGISRGSVPMTVVRSVRGRGGMNERYPRSAGFALRRCPSAERLSAGSRVRQRAYSPGEVHHATRNGSRMMYSKEPYRLSQLNEIRQKMIISNIVSQTKVPTNSAEASALRNEMFSLTKALIADNCDQSGVVPVPVGESHEASPGSSVDCVLDLTTTSSNADANRQRLPTELEAASGLAALSTCPPSVTRFAENVLNGNLRDLIEEQLRSQTAQFEDAGIPEKAAKFTKDLPSNMEQGDIMAKIQAEMMVHQDSRMMNLFDGGKPEADMLMRVDDHSGLVTTPVAMDHQPMGNSGLFPAPSGLAPGRLQLVEGNLAQTADGQLVVLDRAAAEAREAFVAEHISNLRLREAAERQLIARRIMSIADDMVLNQRIPHTRRMSFSEAGLMSHGQASVALARSASDEITRSVVERSFEAERERMRRHSVREMMPPLERNASVNSDMENMPVIGRFFDPTTGAPMLLVKEQIVHEVGSDGNDMAGQVVYNIQEEPRAESFVAVAGMPGGSETGFLLESDMQPSVDNVATAVNASLAAEAAATAAANLHPEGTGTLPPTSSEHHPKKKWRKRYRNSGGTQSRSHSSQENLLQLSPAVTHGNVGLSRASCSASASATRSVNLLAASNHSTIPDLVAPLGQVTPLEKSQYLLRKAYQTNTNTTNSNAYFNFGHEVPPSANLGGASHIAGPPSRIPRSHTLPATGFRTPKSLSRVMPIPAQRRGCHETNMRSSDANAIEGHYAGAEIIDAGMANGMASVLEVRHEFHDARSRRKFHNVEVRNELPRLNNMASMQGVQSLGEAMAAGQRAYARHATDPPPLFVPTAVVSPHEMTATMTGRRNCPIGGKESESMMAGERSFGMLGTRCTGLQYSSVDQVYRKDLLDMSERPADLPELYPISACNSRSLIDPIDLSVNSNICQEKQI